MREKVPLTAKQLRAMPEYDRESMADFAKVLNNDRGCSTPAEEFLNRLVGAYGYGYPITPESIMEDLSHFREEFESAVDGARTFVQRYPAEVLGENCGSEKQQTDALKALAIDEYESVYMLQKARKLIRLCPSLLLRAEEDLPKEWKGLFAKYEAERARKIEA